MLTKDLKYKWPTSVVDDLYEIKRYFDSLHEDNDSFILIKIQVDTHPGGYADWEYPYQVTITSQEGEDLEQVTQQNFKTEIEAFMFGINHLNQITGLMNQANQESDADLLRMWEGFDEFTKKSFGDSLEGFKAYRRGNYSEFFSNYMPPPQE